MLEIYEIQWALELAVVAYVVTCILMMQGNLLEWWYDALIWVEDNCGSWIAKPLGLCEKCFAGQLALWIYLFTHIEWYQDDFWFTLQKHLTFTALTILFTLIIQTTLSKWK